MTTLDASTKLIEWPQSVSLLLLHVLSVEALADLLIEQGPNGVMTTAAEREIPREIARWLRLAEVRDDLVIGRIAQRLRARDIDFLETWQGDCEKLDALAEQLRDDEHTLEWLKASIVPQRRAGMIASLLVRARPYWQLPLTCNLSLSEAHLQFAKWSGSNLLAARMIYTAVSDADLSSGRIATCGGPTYAVRLFKWARRAAGWWAVPTRPMARARDFIPTHMRICITSNRN